MNVESTQVRAAAIASIEVAALDVVKKVAISITDCLNATTTLTQGWRIIDQVITGWSRIVGARAITLIAAWFIEANAPVRTWPRFTLVDINAGRW